MRTLIRVKQSLRLILDGKSEFSHYLKGFEQSYIYGKPCGNLFSREFSKICEKLEKLSRISSCSILMRKLERALRERQLDEAWKTYKDFRCLYCFPCRSLVSNLITELSYSADSKCLHRASELVLSISAEKSFSLRTDLMTKLVLSLARAQVPVQTSNILRLMLEKKSLPPLNVLQMVFLYLVKTQVGTYLASNILGEICDFFQKINLNKSSQTEFTKPDVTIFNLVLDASVRFGLPLKGQQIVELMPQLGVVADARTVVIISRIYESNGMRDELKKFKGYIDAVPFTLAHHYPQFYDCLLSLDFKFDDIVGASALLLDICGLSESNLIQRSQRALEKSCVVAIGSDNIKTGLRLQFLPLQVHKDSIYKVDTEQDFIVHKNGKFVLSNKGLAKLIIGYRRSGRIGELSKLLIHIQGILCYPASNTFYSDVIGSCIHLGWLETAHDILEDLESENYSVSKNYYMSLLTAYYNKNMYREAEGLAKQIRKVHSDVDVSSEMAFFSNKDVTSTFKSSLAESIAQNVKQGDISVASIVHVYNSSIYFFTKAKMIGDAMITYHKMQGMKIHPTGSTFFYLISGHSSLGMYREITILWGDIKRSMSNQSAVYNRDLYELLLQNFIRGGYFERVMDVIGFMMKNGMYLDKWNYKKEFMKFHGDLYSRLSAADAKTEAQSRRIEYVHAFRKWVGIG